MLGDLQGEIRKGLEASAWISWDAHSGESQLSCKFNYLESTMLMGRVGALRPASTASLAREPPAYFHDSSPNQQLTAATQGTSGESRLANPFPNS